MTITSFGIPNDSEEEHLFRLHLHVVGVWLDGLGWEADVFGLLEHLDWGTENQLGQCLSEIFSEFEVVGILELRDSVRHLLEDLNSVDHQILSNVVDEGGWLSEVAKHLLEGIEVGLDTLALGDAGLGLGDGLSELLDSGAHSSDAFLLKVLDCLEDLLEDDLTIIDASLDVLEALSLDGTVEDSHNNFLGSFWIGLQVLHDVGFASHLVTDEDHGEGVTNIFTKGFIFHIIILFDSILDLSIDIASIDENVFSNMDGEGLWVAEGEDQLIQLLKLSNIGCLGAELDRGGNGHEHISHVLKSLRHSFHRVLPQVLHGILDIGGNLFSIGDRAGHIIFKVFGF
jgi:hypothetical protein